MADLKNQRDNLLLLASVEGEFSQKREQTEIADSTEVWLRALQGHVADVEDGTKETFRTRRQLVKLLVAELTVSKKPENGETEVRITYRFSPLPASGGRRAILPRWVCLVMLSRTVADRRGRSVRSRGRTRSS